MTGLFSFFLCSQKLFYFPQIGKLHKTKNKTFLTPRKNPTWSMLLHLFHICRVYSETFPCTNCFLWTIQAEVHAMLHQLLFCLPFVKYDICPKIHWLKSYAPQALSPPSLISQWMCQPVVGLSLTTDFMIFLYETATEHGFCSIATGNGYLPFLLPHTIEHCPHISLWEIWVHAMPIKQGILLRFRFINIHCHVGSPNPVRV